MLAALPWVPVPLPAVALIWTGPMAWVPVIAWPLMIVVVVTGRQASLWALEQDAGVWATLGILLSLLWLGARVLRMRREKVQDDEGAGAEA